MEASGFCSWRRRSVHIRIHGADGSLLMELAARGDVERVQLQMNYRSGSRIVMASEMALGEARGYQASDPAREATIEFVLRAGGMDDQVAHAVRQIIPAALAAKPGRTPGDIAVLYKDYRAGNFVAEAVTAGATITSAWIRLLRTERLP